MTAGSRQWPGLKDPGKSHVLRILIVGLNVATKGAQPFSRGKRVVPGKRDVPHRPFLPPKK